MKYWGLSERFWCDPWVIQVVLPCRAVIVSVSFFSLVSTCQLPQPGIYIWHLLSETARENLVLQLYFGYFKDMCVNYSPRPRPNPRENGPELGICQGNSYLAACYCCSQKEKTLFHFCNSSKYESRLVWPWSRLVWPWSRPTFLRRIQCIKCTLIKLKLIGIQLRFK